MRKIVVRKTQSIKLTSSAQPLYGGICSGGGPVLA